MLSRQIGLHYLRIRNIIFAHMRILIVDDSSLQRALWQHALADIAQGSQANGGLLIFLAEDGDGARSILATQPIDVLVADIEMPGLDGWQVARLAQRQTPGLPTIIVSSKVRSGQPPEDGLDPRCTFVVAKQDRAAAIEFVRKLIDKSDS